MKYKRSYLKYINTACCIYSQWQQVFENYLYDHLWTDVFAVLGDGVVCDAFELGYVKLAVRPKDESNNPSNFIPFT